MIKLIACDLDETLLNDHKEITERNAEMIKLAKQEYGVKFVPATGRGYTCIDSILDRLATKEKEGEYIISNNGGVLVENKGYRKLSFHALPFAKAKELFAFGYAHEVCIQVFTDEDVYAFHIDEDEKKWLFSFKADSILCEADNLEFLKEKPIVKILFQNTNQDILRRLAKAMEPITQGTVSVSYSSNRYLELNAYGVDKGVGLRELAEHLHIPMEETMAIGDNLNDLAMLREAGVAVGVANACEEVKAVCDYITKATHNEDAVAEAIENYVIRGRR